jgi:AraC-like DNA-binding protein
MNYLVDSFFSISLFGFIFTTAFLIRRKPLGYYFFISVYFIYVTSLFVNLAMANGLIVRLPHLYRIVSPLQFLFGPLCYLFCRTTLRPYQKFQNKDLLHFIPFLVAAIGLIPIFMLSGAEKLELIYSNSVYPSPWYKPDTFGLSYVVVLRVKFVFFLGYLVFMWKMLFDFKKFANAELQSNNGVLIAWLYFDTILQSFLGVAILVSAVWIGYFNDTILVQMTLVCVEIIASAFFLIARPELLKGLLFENAILSPDLQYADYQEYKEKKDLDVQPEGESIDLTHQVNDEKDLRLKAETMRRIEQYIQLNQPFLDPEFSLSDLSIALTIHPRIVSSAIKSTLGMGFPEYTNKIRFIYLEEQLQKKAEMLDFSIDAIAKIVGFSSRSGFYKAFKKYSSFDSPNRMLDYYRSKK